MRQTGSLSLAQVLKVPIRHRALHVRGNSAAVESFAGLDHGGKYGVAEVLTIEEPVGQLNDRWCELAESTSDDECGSVRLRRSSVYKRVTTLPWG
jgi:hypothetical protein